MLQCKSIWRTELLVTAYLCCSSWMLLLMLSLQKPSMTISLAKQITASITVHCVTPRGMQRGKQSDRGAHSRRPTAVSLRRSTRLACISALFRLRVLRYFCGLHMQCCISWTEEDANYPAKLFACMDCTQAEDGEACHCSPRSSAWLTSSLVRLWLWCKRHHFCQAAFSKGSTHHLYVQDLNSRRGRSRALTARTPCRRPCSPHPQSVPPRPVSLLPSAASCQGCSACAAMHRRSQLSAGQLSTARPVQVSTGLLKQHGQLPAIAQSAL